MAKLIDINLIAMDRGVIVPRVVLDNEDLEMPIPEGRPDVVVNSFNFEQNIGNKDYQYHQLSMKVLGCMNVNRIMIHTLGD